MEHILLIIIIIRFIIAIIIMQLMFNQKLNLKKNFSAQSILTNCQMEEVNFNLAWDYLQQIRGGHPSNRFKNSQHYLNYLEKKHVKFIQAYFLQVNVCINVSYDGDLIKVLLRVISDGALPMFPLAGYYYLFVVDSLMLATDLIARTLDIGLYFQEVIFDDQLISGQDLTDVLSS